jgi:DNA-binding NtrC family response regulator
MPTILLVDDEQAVLDGIRRSLRHENYNLLTATSGAEALEICASVRVSVMVSDQMMPGMSGTELLSEVNKNYPDTIRLMLTGQATMDAAIEAINEGEVFRFLRKPVNQFELSLAVRQALEHREMLYDVRMMKSVIKQQASLIESFANQAQNFVAKLDRMNPARNPAQVELGSGARREVHVLDLDKYGDFDEELEERDSA